MTNIISTILILFLSEVLRTALNIMYHNLFILNIQPSNIQYSCNRYFLAKVCDCEKLK